MNIQTHAMGAVFPAIAATIAGPRLLAGLTLVPVNPIPRICTRVRVRPITSPPKEPCPAFLLVTPKIVKTKMNVKTTSTSKPACFFTCQKCHCITYRKLLEIINNVMCENLEIVKKCFYQIT